MRSAIMKFFAFDHLPPHLQEIAKPFSTAAEFVDLLPAGSEAALEQKQLALTLLLQAKDAAVRTQVR